MAIYESFFLKKIHISVQAKRDDISNFYLQQQKGVRFYKIKKEEEKKLVQEFLDCKSLGEILNPKLNE